MCEAGLECAPVSRSQALLVWFQEVVGAETI